MDAIEEKEPLETVKSPLKRCITDDTQNSVGGLGKTRKSPRMKPCLYVCMYMGIINTYR